MDGTSVEGYAGALAESATREGPLAAAVAAEAVRTLNPKPSSL
jgi:hypothetical protein